ncbi:MAG: hypothetical protein Q9163_004100, partial [Psora crenata]
DGDVVDVKDEEEDGEEVTVEVWTVVDVRVDVETKVATAAGGGGEDVAFIEELGGEAVTVGLTVTVAVDQASQPRSTQA